MSLKLPKNITCDSRESSSTHWVRDDTNSSVRSIIILTLSVGIPMLAGLWLWMTALIPPHLRQDGLLLWTQSNFTLPALLGKRHSQPLPFKIGYVPNRGTSILIAIYVILNIIFCSAPYNSVQPSSWFSNRNEEMAAYIANRTGVLSFANMALAILFSTRNNPLMYLSGWSQTTFLAFHRWAARIAILQAVIHSIVYTADYCYYRDGGNAYFKEAALPYFWWGIIATTAMGLMAGLSALPLRSHAYELFLVLHIILAILSLMGSWYHVDIRFSKKWGYEIWLYIAFAFWAWDRLVRLLKVAYYNLPTRSSAHAELIPGTDAIMLTIFPGRGWAPQPGQHTFLYFPSLKRFWENHPFTILDWGCSSPSAQHDTTDSISTSSNQTPDKEAITNKNEATVQAQSSPNPQTQFYIRCLFRAHKGTTSTLHTSLLNHPLPTLPTFSEGPYGTLPAPTKSLLRHADKILCIAGGIGITFATGFVKQFAHERSLTSPSSSAQKSRDLFPRCKEFVLAWTVREPELLDCGRERFLPALEAGGLDDGSLRYKFFLTGGRREEDLDSQTASSSRAKEIDTDAILPEKAPQVSTTHYDLVTLNSGRRMDVASLVATESNVGLDARVVVLVCGPGGLADEVRFQVVCRARQGVLVDLIEEGFEW